LSSLLEATTHFLFPKREFFLRSVSVVNVTTAEDAPSFEHALSILSSSYVEFGGLNDTLGGNNSMRSTITNTQKKDTWENGLTALAKQDIYLDNMKSIRKRLKLEQRYQRALTDGIDTNILEEAQAEKEAAAERCINRGKLLIGKCQFSQAPRLPSNTS
jgi:hypothetical protein